MTGLLPSGTASAIGRMLTPEPERELPQDPVKWVADHGGFLWSKQREVMRSVLEHRYTAVPAASGVGKSYDAGQIATWWIEAHPIGEAIAITSAPNDDLIGDVLWKEIRRTHTQNGLMGRTNLANEWYVGPAGSEELVAMGRKPADMANPDQAMARFSGRHARYVLVLLDEAVGIPEWLWDAADTLVTNSASRILAIGNPDDPTSHFEKVCRPGSGWNVVPISVYDTPNFTNEPVPEYLRELLPSRQWVEERAERWGKDSARYKSRVLGVFPDTSDENVITPAMVVAAQNRELPGTERGCYGLDVARFGHDSTQLYRSRGGVIRKVAEWRKEDTEVTADRTASLVQPEVPVAVDADGIGGGVYDKLRRRTAGFLPIWVIAFTAQDKVRQPRRFANRRSELWWTMREAFEDGQVDLDPADEDLAAQLQQPKWGYDGRGRIKVETKEEMSKRGLPSPDKADAAIMAEIGGPPESMRPPHAGVPVTNGHARRPLTAGLRGRPM